MLTVIRKAYLVLVCTLIPLLFKLFYMEWSYNKEFKLLPGVKIVYGKNGL